MFFLILFREISINLYSEGFYRRLCSHINHRLIYRTVYYWKHAIWPYLSNVWSDKKRYTSYFLKTLICQQTKTLFGSWLYSWNESKLAHFGQKCLMFYIQTYAFHKGVIQKTIPLMLVIGLGSFMVTSFSFFTPLKIRASSMILRCEAILRSH